MMMGMYDSMWRPAGSVLAMSPDLWAMSSGVVCLGLAVLLGFHFIHRFKRDVRERQLMPSKAMSFCNRRTLVSTLFFVGAGVLIWIFRIQIFVYWLRVGGP